MKFVLVIIAATATNISIHREDGFTSLTQCTVAATKVNQMLDIDVTSPVYGTRATCFEVGE